MLEPFASSAPKRPTSSLHALMLACNFQDQRDMHFCIDIIGLADASSYGMALLPCAVVPGRAMSLGHVALCLSNLPDAM